VPGPGHCGQWGACEKFEQAYIWEWAPKQAQWLVLSLLHNTLWYVSLHPFPHVDHFPFPFVPQNRSFNSLGLRIFLVNFLGTNRQQSVEQDADQMRKPTCVLLIVQKFRACCVLCCVHSVDMFCECDQPDDIFHTCTYHVYHPWFLLFLGNLFFDDRVSYKDCSNTGDVDSQNPFSYSRGLDNSAFDDRFSHNVCRRKVHLWEGC